MTLLPIVEREMRASARQSFTYSLRGLGVVVLVVASILFGRRVGFGADVGRDLFMALHGTLFGAIWVLVPMLAADCISRERREGTLGLLFLTPLKGRDIVVAKGLAQALRAVTLGLAVVPILTFPIMLGGVSRAEVALAVVVNANAACWALAAGLLASAWSTAWRRALVRAVLLAAVCFIVLATSVGWFLLNGLTVRPSALVESEWRSIFVAGVGFFANAEDCWTVGGGSFWGPGTRAWGWVSLCSLLALFAAVAGAGARVRRCWREEPPSPRQVRLERAFCTPVLWQSFFRRWMRRKLERNPIGWLEQRTWQGRLVTWAWVAVLISVYTTVLTDRHFFWVADGIQEGMALILAGSIAAGAAGSFRRERETGVLELLLVSPLSEGRIIFGRVQGLWSQFLPAAGVLLLVWPFTSTFLPNRSGPGVWFFYGVTFLTLPVFGLYFSLRFRTFIAAFLFTIAVGLLVPPLLAELARFLIWVSAFWWVDFQFGIRATVLAACYQMLLAGFCWWRLHRLLKRRTVPLVGAVGQAGT